MLRGISTAPKFLSLGVKKAFLTLNSNNIMTIVSGALEKALQLWLSLDSTNRVIMHAYIEPPIGSPNQIDPTTFGKGKWILMGYDDEAREERELYPLSLDEPEDRMFFGKYLRPEFSS